MIGSRLKKEDKPKRAVSASQPVTEENTTPLEFKKEPKAEDISKLYTKSKRKKIAGLLLLFFSLILFCAQASFFFSWKEDFDKIQMGGFYFLFTHDIAVANVMGRIGLWLAYYTSHIGFGLPAVLIDWIVFLWGAKLFFKNFNGFSFLRAVRSMAWMMYLSVAVAFIFSSSDFLYGGYGGLMIAGWLSNFMGGMGVSLFLIGCLLVYLIYLTNFTINYQSLALYASSLWKPDPAEEKLYAEEIPLPQKTTEITHTPELLNNETSEQSVPAEGETANEEEQTESPAPIPFRKIDISKTTVEPNVGDHHLLDMILVQEKLQSLHAMEGEMHGHTPPLEESFTQPPTERTSPPSPIQELYVQTKKDEVMEDITQDEEPVAPITKEKEEQEIEFDISNPIEKVVEESLEEVAPLPIIEAHKYRLPPTSLLHQYPSDEIAIDQQELEANKQQIIQTLNNFKINIRKISATIGPTVTLYEIIPEDGTRISKIKNLEDDIALSLSALGIRIIAPIPGKGTIGIEVPNKHKKMVSLRTLLKSAQFQEDSKHILPIAFGKAIDNTDYIVDLAKMPHILMAGATGQGKSVGLNVLLMSLLYKKTPDDLKLVLVDPKKVELSLFRKLEKHFLAKIPSEDEPIITDTKKVINVLNSLCVEMDHRYDLLKEAACKNIEEYNRKIREKRHQYSEEHVHLPYIVIVIDEFADLIMTAGKEVELPIARIAQLARAVGLHLVIATQRPSVNIITGMIKANFPVRVAFKVSSKVDSRTILDEGGAEQLVGKGDMLISNGGTLTRLQCAFVDTEEVENVCEFISQQPFQQIPYFLPETDVDSDDAKESMSVEDRDPLFEEAARLIVSTQSGSTSLIQRKMKLGFNRAGRLMDQLEMAGIVSPARGAKPRDVLVRSEMELDSLLSGL